MGAKDKAAFYSSIPLQKKAFQLVVKTGYKGSLLSAPKDIEIRPRKNFHQTALEWGTRWDVESYFLQPFSWADHLAIRVIFN